GAAEETEDCGDGDEEVKGAIEEVPELDEAPVVDERLLHRPFVEDVQPALDVDDVPRMVERVGVRHRRGALHVPHDRVDDVEREDIEDLPPPAQAQGTSQAGGIRTRLSLEL